MTSRSRRGDLLGAGESLQGSRVGRPRNPDTDAAIHDAVRAVLQESGYGALTYEQVARRAGVSRPTLYRRAASKVALVVGALIESYGLAPVPDTGNVTQDLMALQDAQVRLYNDPVIGAALPGVLADIRTDVAAQQEWVAGFVRPRRDGVMAAVERAVRRGELADDTDAEWVCEILTGPLISAAFLTGNRSVRSQSATDTVQLVMHRYGQPSE